MIFLMCPIYMGYSAKATIYYSPYTHETIKLDGILNESAWLKTDSMIFLIPVSLDTPSYPAEGKILWDDHSLYIGIMAKDKDIKALLTHRDDSTYLDDVLEIFLQPEPGSSQYVNFEINPLGTIYDALNDYRFDVKYRKIDDRWNCEELKPGIQIQGTINKSDDIDEYWTLELQIPFSCISSLLKSNPQPGSQWKFHLARYDYFCYPENGTELSSSAPLSRINFHNYKDWMILEFKEK